MGIIGVYGFISNLDNSVLFSFRVYSSLLISLIRASLLFTAYVGFFKFFMGIDLVAYDEVVFVLLSYFIIFFYESK